MDAERVKVAEALGFRAMSAREWLYIAYDAAGRTLHEAMRANRGYDGIKAPKTVYNRYISEDVPMSLVPLASLGRQAGVDTPTIDSVIHLCSVLHGVDYWTEGRTVESLGLAGMSLKQIRRFILEGEANVSDGWNQSGETTDEVNTNVEAPGEDALAMNNEEPSVLAEEAP